MVPGWSGPSTRVDQAPAPVAVGQPDRVDAEPTRLPEVRRLIEQGWQLALGPTVGFAGVPAQNRLPSGVRLVMLWRDL